MHDTNETIFIVDDDPSVLKSLTRLIRAGGWNVEPYASGREFLARLPFSGRGCVILDLMMPDMSGLEVCSQMAALCPSLPTILLTGGDDFKLRATAASGPAVNFVDFVTKPVDGEILLSGIRRALAPQGTSRIDFIGGPSRT